MSVAVERDAALLDAQNIAREYGVALVVFVRGESGVVRDTYQSIAQFTQAGGIAIYAWPVIYDPQRRELDRAGIYERCDVLVWTPMKEWTDQGYRFRDIDAVRGTVVMVSYDAETGAQGNLEYRIREKQRASRFADTDLHIVFALTKRE